MEKKVFKKKVVHGRKGVIKVVCPNLECKRVFNYRVGKSKFIECSEECHNVILERSKKKGRG